MKRIEMLRSGDISVKFTDGQKSRIQVKNARQERAKAALCQAKSFLANNPEQVINLLGDNVEDELKVFQNPDFLPMVNAIRYARVSKSRFLRAIGSLIENSPSSPEENVGKLCAQKFTEVVYQEKKRLEIESSL